MVNGNGWAQWLRWVIGAVVIVTVPPILWFALGIDRDGRRRQDSPGAPGSGIHVTATGITASNTVSIQVAPAHPPASEKGLWRESKGE